MSAATYEQIVNQPFLYANNGQLSWTSNTTLTVAAGQFRDTTNSYDINIGNFLGVNPGVTANTNTVINGAVNGVNGLDTGALANNTLYYVYVIVDPQLYHLPACIISKNLPSVGPLMPFGYGAYRRIGQVTTNGSAQFLLFYQVGTGSSRTYQFDAPIAVVSAAGSTTVVAAALNPYIPSISAYQVAFNAAFTPATAGNAFSLQPTGGTGFPVVATAEVVSQAQKYVPFRMLALLNAASPVQPSIGYKTTSASDALTLNIIGYDDTI